MFTINYRKLYSSFNAERKTDIIESITDYRMFWTKRGKMICYFHFLVRPISDLYEARYGKLFLSPFDVYFRCFFRCFFVRNIWARNENRIWRPGELAWKPIEARRNLKNVHHRVKRSTHSLAMHPRIHAYRGFRDFTIYHPSTVKAK